MPPAQTVSDVFGAVIAALGLGNSLTAVFVATVFTPMK